MAKKRTGGIHILPKKHIPDLSVPTIDDATFLASTKHKRDQLSMEIAELHSFFGDPGFLELSEHSQTLMRMQSAAMMTYFMILDMRVEDWGL